MSRGVSGSESVAARAEDILRPITDAGGYIIYDVEYIKEAGERVLRAYIDKKPGGVTIDDCEVVSRAFSDALDEADMIDEAYILEVSSPGLTRQLKKDRHLQYSIGEPVEVKTFSEVDGMKEFEGELKGFDKNTVTINLKGDVARIVERKNIAVMRLTPEL